MIYYTQNIFEVYDLYVSNSSNEWLFNDRNIVRPEMIMRSRLIFMCSKLGNTASELLITTRSRGYCNEQMIKELIQKLFSGVSEFTYCVYDNDTISHVKKGVDKVIINLQEPYKSFFESIFDPSKWKMDEEFKIFNNEKITNYPSNDRLLSNTT